MARYMERAAEANKVAQELLEGILCEEDKPHAAELIARLYNLGIRTAPRAVQSTVRYNAVKRAVQDLPVKVSMEQRVDEQTKRTYNALVTQPIGGKPTAEDSSCEILEPQE